VLRERQSPYAIAFCLLVAGAIPALAWTAEDGFKADFTSPTPWAAAFGESLSRSAVFYPAVAGVLALFLAGSMPRWLRGLGFVAIGGLLLVIPAEQGAVEAVVNNQFAVPATDWDLILLGGVALVFVATRAQADEVRGLPLSLLAAVGGLAVLAFLLVPRGVSAADTWLGLVSRDHADTFPIARGFLRNGEFAEGTHPMRYVWWNLYLVALVVFPLLCLRVPVRFRELRPSAADGAYGALVFALMSVPLMAITVAALGETFKPAPGADGSPAPWQPLVVGAANSARLLLPPLLLAGLALAGVSDLLKSVSAVRVPRPGAGWKLRLPKLRLPRWPQLSRRQETGDGPPVIPVLGSAPRRPGRIKMVTDVYGNAERV
jgi:hypothetical protein